MNSLVAAEYSGAPAKLSARLRERILRGDYRDGQRLPAERQLAAEHGVSADKLQQLMAGFGGPEAIMGQIGSLFDRDGDGNPANELSGIAKGLFG